MLIMKQPHYLLQELAHYLQEIINLLRNQYQGRVI